MTNPPSWVLMPTRRVIFDWFICLALFNLLLLRVWAQLLPAVMNPANLYYMDRAPHWIHYPTVLATLFGASTLACAAATWARRSRRRAALGLAQAALLVLFVAALNSLRLQIAPESDEAAWQALGAGGVAGIGAGLAIAVAWLLLRHARGLFAAIEVFAIFAAPFLFMTVGQALWAWSRYSPEAFAGARLRPPPVAAKLPARPEAAARVVWIIFDELDQRAAFDARPPHLELPELDRLREESFFAHNAYPPAGETRRSLASMLLGLQVGWAMPDGPTTLPCALEGTPPESATRDCWSDHPNLFAKARARGVNVGVAGWYHPFCRLFFESLSACTWAGLPYWDSSRVVDSLDQQWEEVIKPIPLLRLWLEPGARIRGAHRKAYVEIRAAALELAADPEIGLAFLHFPVPHHPDIYDPDRGELSIDDERSYLDNLVLVDRTLGEVRAAMEASGVWDVSTLIVTSDHWWRAIHRGDWGLLPEEKELWAGGLNRRVPFLVRFPGEATSRGFNPPFNTLLVHDLVLEVLAGNLRTTADLRDWIRANRARAPVPYPVQRPARAASGPNAP